MPPPAQTLCSVLLVFVLNIPFLESQRAAGGGEGYPDLRTNLGSLEEWRKLRFGMFIHWGPVSLRGTEIGWSRGKEVPFQDYDRLYEEFNPMLFDAADWVRTARRAGMKYIVLVTKHHDGFALWDSALTDYDIMATPFQRDVVAELAEECQEQGLLFGTYYSILDWYHPDYPVKLDRTGLKPEAQMPRYVNFMKGQLRELIEKYRTRVLWFDGEWEDPWTHQLGMELYAWVRGQDDTILVNNRVDKGRSGMDGFSLSSAYAGDFETPEQRVGQFDTSTPWESCITLGTQWSWKPNDRLKTVAECIRVLVQTAGGDGNLLLNVSPMLDGRMERRQAALLEQIGRWLSVFGETVYGTRGGPVPPQSWGVTTCTEDRVYVHVLDPSRSELLLPGIKEEFRSMRIFPDGPPIFSRPTPEGLVLRVPGPGETPPHLVLELSR